MATQDAKIVRVKKGKFFVVEREKQLYKNVFHLFQDPITRKAKKSNFLGAHIFRRTCLLTMDNA
jgi:hypothetical protein